MRQRADVVVAGASPAGLAAAFALAGRGLGTLVLDPGRSAGATASTVPSLLSLLPGLFAPHAAPEAVPGALRELSLLAGSLLEEWVEAIEEASGLSCELDLRGVVSIARTDAEEVDLDRALDWQRRRALSFEVLAAGEAISREPALGDEVLAAFAFPRDGSVQPERLLEALRAAARSRGAEILEGVVPLGVAPGAESEGWEVRTASGIFPAAAVIDAGGLPPGFGYGYGSGPGDDPGTPASIPVSMRRTVALLDAAADPDRPTRPLLGGGVHLVPRRGGTLLAAAPPERGGADPRPSAAALADLLGRAARLAPAAGDYPLLGCGVLTGTRPADGLPLLGEASRSGLFISSGFGVEELELAPAAAAILAALLSGERPPIDPEPFSPERFRP